MNLNGDYGGDCGVAWSLTDPITLTIVSGNEYASFHTSDSQTGLDTKLGSAVTTTGNNVGKYSLVADGVTADSNNCWVTVQAESDGIIKTDSVQILPSVNHFYVYAAPDTIENSGKTTLYVQAQDKNNEDVDYDGDVLISASPSEYGHLGYSAPAASMQESGVKGKQATTQSVSTAKNKFVAMGDSLVEVDYWTARYGGVNYTANGVVPDSDTTVNFTVTAADQTSVTGKGFVVIQGPQLVVIYPTDRLKDEKDITKDPKMPDITAKAKLENFKGDSVHFQWNLRVQWEGPDGRQFDDPFPGNTAAKNSQVSQWPIYWNNMIRGGDELTLDVTATAGGKVYDKTVDHGFVIKGDNPDKAVVREGLTTEEQVFIYMESRFRQFKKNKDFPYFGDPHGYGLGQIDNIGRTGRHATDEEVWNWQVNRETSKGVYNDKKKLAENYSTRINNGRTWYWYWIDKTHKIRRFNDPLNNHWEWYRYAYTQASPLTDGEELLKETFQRFNGGVYWRWIPYDPEDSNSTGKWVKVTSGTYGDEAWNIYNGIVNYNTYPGDWN